jgi:hypothetical protein
VAITDLHKEKVKRGRDREARKRGNRDGFPVHRTQAKLTVAKATTVVEWLCDSVGAAA